MKTILEPVGPEIKWHKGSDVTEITHTASGLRVVLASPKGEDRYVEFHFPIVRAFQVMDEGDMLEFWKSPVTPGHALYKVMCWRSPKTDHLCALKIDQGWSRDFGLPARPV